MIHHQLEDVISLCMEDALSEISLFHTLDNCYSTAKTGFYFLELSRLGLWPISESLRQCSVEQVFDKLSAFQLPPDIGSLLARYHNTFYGPSRSSTLCSCKTCRTSFSVQLQDVVDEQRKELGGLCLTCVRAGKTSLAKGNCQTECWCTAIFKLIIQGQTFA